MAKTKTLLLGVGGLGSYIVNEIQGKLSDDLKDYVSIMCLDTDKNTMDELDNLLEEQKLRTSQDMEVGHYLDIRKRAGDTSPQEWFQGENILLRKKNMIDGAGQVRAVSRLAFRAALAAGQINLLINELSRISQERGEGGGGYIRVGIVGSLAGGTGSGIFLQLALTIREILKKRFDAQSILIKGFFLLPSTINSKIKGEEERERIYANGYASVKELNALTLLGLKNKIGSKKIDFEFMPSLHQAKIEDVGSPYDYLYLIDELNIKGNNIGGMENYMSMLSSFVYLDLFSKLAAKGFSKIDNQILNLIESNGLNRYCAGGAGKLAFPVDRLMEYFSLRMTTESIDRKWPYFDELYQKDYREFKNQRRSGNMNVERPVLREKYLFYLQSELNKDNIDVFYKLIERQLNLYDEEKEFIGKKSEIFVDNIIAKIEQLVGSNEKMSQIFSSLQPDVDQFVTIEEARDAIRNIERRVGEYQKACEEFINNNKVLPNQILFDDEFSPNNCRGEDYYLNTWILKDEVMHPMATRCFIYEVVVMLEEIVDSLRADLKRHQDGFEAQLKKYDDPSTEHIVETAYDAFNEMAERARFYNKRRRLKDFTEEYVQSVRDRSGMVRKLTMKELEFLTFSKILTHLKRKEGIIERFFKNISREADTLYKRQDKIVNDFQKKSGYERFVLSKTDSIQKLWEDQEAELVDVDMASDDISRSIYLSLYKKFTASFHNHNIKEDLSESFMRSISNKMLESNRGTIKKVGFLDMDVLSAMRLEARYEGMEEEKIDDYVFDQLRWLKNVVIPFGPSGDLIEEGKVSYYTMWGVNSEVFDSISQGVIAKLTDDEITSATEFVDDHSFSRYEIVRSSMIFCQSLSQYKKFMPGATKGAGGEYYESYQSRLTKIFDPKITTVSPHLDKRWHLRTYLPPIFDMDKEKGIHDIIDATIKGFMLGDLKLRTTDGEMKWHYKLDVLQDCDLNPIDETDVTSLVYALMENPFIVEEILEAYEGEKETQKKKYLEEIKSYSLLKGLKKIGYSIASEKGKKEFGILDLCIHFSKSPYYEEEDHKELNDKLGARLRSILEELISFAFGKIGKNKLADEYAHLMQHHIRRNASYFNSFDEESDESRRLLEAQLK